MLSDWTDEDPSRIFGKLKKQSNYYNAHRRTVGDFLRDVQDQGFAATVSDRAALGDMRMSPSELADVNGATYTYLVNGRPPAGNWTGLFRPGERVRLRFINGSAMTHFDVRIPGLRMTVVAADGQYGMAMQEHPKSEDGNPFVDMQTMRPTSRLDDPGIGLRNNGRRVLTYADLRNLFDDPDGREPGRTVEMHLTGHRFVWSFDGVKFSDADPIRMTYGERLLHRPGQRHDDDAPDTPARHVGATTSRVTTGSSSCASTPWTCRPAPGAPSRVRADALGRWAFHCHLLYHMAAGMFREVRVEE